MKQLNFEKLNAVMRMFSLYTEQGKQPAETILKLHAQLGASYAKEVSLMERSFSNEGNGFNKVNLPEDMFFRSLKEHISETGGDSDKVLLAMSTNMANTSNGFRACSRFYNSIYVYPSIVMVVAMLVYFIYKVFVFESMAAAFGGIEIMPELSRLVFSDLAALILGVSLVLSFIFIAIATVNLQRNISLFRPSNSWFARELSCGNEQNYLLFLMYYKTMLNCGSNPQQALAKSRQYAGIGKTALYGYKVSHDMLSLVSTEGEAVVNKEVTYQLQNTNDQMENKLVAKQEKMLSVFQILIFSVVALLVLAMYMPIFKLGSIV